LQNLSTNVDIGLLKSLVCDGAVDYPLGC